MPALHNPSLSPNPPLPQWGSSPGVADKRNEKPSLSIVIPAFNEAHYIACTLDSVFKAAADYDGHVESIVVDNNSSDGTGRIAKAIGARVVFEPVNQIARARNAGAKAATGDYLIFLDADTRIEGDILNKVATHLSGGQIIGGGAWVEPDSGWIGQLVFKLMINRVLALKNVTVGPFLFCDRRAFHRVGGFDENLYAAEEFSLAKRLKAEGLKQNKAWKIIKQDSGHRIVTSSRKFKRFGGLEMALHNVRLIWNPHHKLRQKDHCKFWYEARREKTGNGK